MIEKKQPGISARCTDGLIRVTVAVYHDVQKPQWGVHETPVELTPEAAVRFGEKLAQLGRSMLATKKAGA